MFIIKKILHIGKLISCVVLLTTLSTPTIAGDDIVIGVPTNLSGPIGGADHMDWQNGVNLAVSEINAAGGVNGRALRVEVVDTDILTPEGTVAAFQALIEKGSHAIASSFVLIPQVAMDAAASNGIPYMHGNTSLVSLEMVRDNPKKYRNIFQIDGAETWYGSGLINYLDSMNKNTEWNPINNKVHIVQGQIAYTQTVSKSAQEAIAASSNWELTKVTDIAYPVADWAPIVKDLNESGAGVIFISHWVAAELASFAQQYAYDPVPGALVYLQYGPSQPEFLELAAGAAEGMIWGTVIGNQADEQGMAFRKAYADAYGDNMGVVYTGSAYDTIHMLAKVWSEVPAEDFDAVGDAIRNLTYDGVSGTYTFNRATQAPLVHPWQTNDKSLGVTHLLYQVQDNQHKIIMPLDMSESVFRP